jgi:hypothetical protein
VLTKGLGGTQYKLLTRSVTNEQAAQPVSDAEEQEHAHAHARAQEQEQESLAGAAKEEC